MFHLSANNFAQKQKRKTLTAPDVFEALEEMEFEQFIKPLKESLACECFFNFYFKHLRIGRFLLWMFLCCFFV